MTSFEKVALVPFSQKEMYDLVANVAAYPDFLPWCHQVDILDSGVNSQVVRIVLSQHRLNLSLTTLATFQPETSLHLKQVEASFLSSFEGQWDFAPATDTPVACHVTFTVNYCFPNFMAELALSPFFGMVVRMLPSLFINQAHKIYRRRP